MARARMTLGHQGLAGGHHRGDVGDAEQAAEVMDRQRRPPVGQQEGASEKGTPPSATMAEHHISHRKSFLLT